MEALEHDYQEFAELLTQEELYDLALPYGAAEKRDRKLPIRIFFWLMILSAGQPTVRGGLFQLAAFFVAALTQLFPLHQAITLTKMALSTRMSGTSWFFFRAVYNRLLWRYQKDLPTSQRNLFSRFREAFALGATRVFGEPLDCKAVVDAVQTYLLVNRPRPRRRVPLTH